MLGGDILRILSWNVNGIRAIAKKGFIEWISKENPDILCLQETKAHKEQLDDSLIHIDGYYSYFCSGERKGYSGVAVYTKREPLSVAYGFSMEERFDAEGRILVLEYEDFYLINIYYPNGGQSSERLQYKMDFYDAFLIYLNNLKATTEKGIVVCGDVNTAHNEIDLARPKENAKYTGFLPMERQWIDQLIEHGYVDTFREFCKEPERYTWWDMKTRARDRNVGWRIDYFFVNREYMSQVQDAFILAEVMGSDHCPIGIALK